MLNWSYCIFLKKTSFFYIYIHCLQLPAVQLFYTRWQHPTSDGLHTKCKLVSVISWNFYKASFTGVNLMCVCTLVRCKTWDSGGSCRSSCSLWTTWGKSPAWKHTTSLVTRGGSELQIGVDRLRRITHYLLVSMLLLNAPHHMPLHCLPLSGAYGLQHPHGCCGLTFKTLPDVISVGPSPILEQHLSGLAGPGKWLQQVLDLICGAKLGQKQGRVEKNRQANDN